MTEQIVPVQKDRIFFRYLYNTVSGRILLKLLSAPHFSHFCGRVMDSKLSRAIIPIFVRKNGIELSEYQPCRYRSFNDFFSRQIIPELRPTDTDPEHLISPCDGLMSVYNITNSTVIPVKHSGYSVSELLEDKTLAETYDGGTCLVFRLCVNHYHRYCYADSGMKGGNIHIPGRLHTVRPVAQNSMPVFARNAREYTVIDTPLFGEIVQMEVGALLVGKIQNYHSAGYVRRGEEKGRFLYGGSTVILLLKHGAVRLPDWAFRATDGNCEIPVKMGEMIGCSDRKLSADH